MDELLSSASRHLLLLAAALANEVAKTLLEPAASAAHAALLRISVLSALRQHTWTDAVCFALCALCTLCSWRHGCLPQKAASDDRYHLHKIQAAVMLLKLASG